MKKHKRSIFYIFVAIIIILLAWKVFTILPSDEQKVYTFEKGFKELEKIDNKYNTSFKTEKLNETIVLEDDITLMLEDIKEFEKTILLTIDKDEVRALLLFIDARKLMLVSEWYWHQGNNIGDIGQVLDEEGFGCGEVQYISDAAFYFNETYNYGFQATRELDMLLANYKHIPAVIENIGTNENRLEFYETDFKHIRHIPLNNAHYLKELCGINVKIEGTTDLVDPEKEKLIESLFFPVEIL